MNIAELQTSIPLYLMPLELAFWAPHFATQSASFAPANSTPSVTFTSPPPLPPLYIHPQCLSQHASKEHP